jgi:hypothetical protein
VTGVVIYESWNFCKNRIPFWQNRWRTVAGSHGGYTLHRRHRHRHRGGSHHVLSTARREGCPLIPSSEDETQYDLYSHILTGSDGQFRMVWPELQIICDVERVRTSTDQDVKGELNFTSERPASAGHLRHGRILLTSPTAKKSFAKLLEDRDNQVDWDKVLEQLCVLVVKASRTGSPEVQITGDIEVATQTKWLVNPILQLNNPTLIYGPGASGKSWLGQYLAVLADAGFSHGGLTVEPANTMILDWETTQDEIGARISMIRRGLGLSGQSNVWYKAMSQGLASDIETVRTAVLKRDISFIVLDSMGSAAAGEPESAEVILRLFNSLRSLRVTSLCIDHTNRENTLFGSVYKFNASRQIFEIKKHQAPDDNKIVFALFHKKANNSKLIRDLGFELNFAEPGQVTISKKPVRDTDLAQYQSIPERILNAFRGNNGNGKLTVDDVTEEITTDERPVTKESVRTAMSRMFNNGTLMKRPEDKDREGKQQYVLPAWGFQQDPIYGESFVEEGTDQWKIS